MIRTLRRASSARLCDGAVTVVVATAENSLPGEATMSPETFSMLRLERGVSVALKCSVRFAVKLPSSAPARAEASISSMPRPSRIHRLSQSDALLLEARVRKRLSLFITGRDAVFLMKLLGSAVFARLTTASEFHRLQRGRGLRS